MKNNHFLKAALSYVDQGYAVLPLKPNSKIPYSGIRGYKDATKNKALIEKWWEKWPNANIGIATGKISGIFVIDVDGEIPEGIKLPPATVKTPRGYHCYVQYPENESIKNTGRLNGLPIDIKSDGGHVVAPPSTNLNGGKYEPIKT
jgi:hypothetical protein